MMRYLLNSFQAVAFIFLIPCATCSSLSDAVKSTLVGKLSQFGVPIPTGHGFYFGSDIPVYFADLNYGLPTCDPLNSYKERPYSGYRFSYEIRIPYSAFLGHLGDKNSEPELDFNKLNYANLIRSSYPKYFVMSTCDNNYVKGELTVPVQANGEDIWNRTFCSDYIPTDNIIRDSSGTIPMLRLKYDPTKMERLYQSSRLAKFSPASGGLSKTLGVGKDPYKQDLFKSSFQEILVPHPFYDMFLNRRLRLADPFEPEVRQQYCFHVAKARQFSGHTGSLDTKHEDPSYQRRKSVLEHERKYDEALGNLTPEWDDDSLRLSNFVGAMYQCVDNAGSAMAVQEIPSLDTVRAYRGNNTLRDRRIHDEYGIICTRENMKPVMPLYRDASVNIWAILAPKLDAATFEQPGTEDDSTDAFKHDYSPGQLQKRTFVSSFKSKIGSTMAKSKSYNKVRKIFDQVGESSKVKDAANTESNNLEFIVRIPWLYTPDVMDTGYPNLVKTEGGHVFYGVSGRSSLFEEKIRLGKNDVGNGPVHWDPVSFGEKWGLVRDVDSEGATDHLTSEEIKNRLMGIGWQPFDKRKKLLTPDGSSWQIDKDKRKYRFLTGKRTQFRFKWIKNVDPFEDYSN